MSRLIDADTIPYTMLYKENWLKGTGVEKLGVWKDTIDAMPTIEPERKKGKWIISHVPDSMLWECNQCGFDCGAHSFNFCPMCGAKMERK